MELDELKNNWLALDDRLRKQEVLKATIIKKMLHEKSNKALSRLSNYEWFGVILLPLIIPFILWRLETGNFNPTQTYVFYGYIVLITPLIIWQIIKICTLSKIDFSNTIGHNVRLINRYNLHIKKEKLFSVFLIPLMTTSIILLVSGIKMDTWRWVLIGTIVALTIVLSIWIYKRLYDKSIASILRSLEEMKELEEERE